MQDFKKHLQDQLRFIAKSTREVLKGDLAEASRIATAVRVIAHKTGSSTSILEHLNCPNPAMLSTGRVPERDAIWASGNLYQIRSGPNGMGIAPKFNGGHSNRTLPFSEWWNEIVEILDRSKVSRRDIILAASNKDGGAHVDERLPEVYAALKAGPLMLSAGAGPPKPMHMQIACDIVQIGYEVYHSPGYKRCWKIRRASAKENAARSEAEHRWPELALFPYAVPCDDRQQSIGGRS
jgi:hypothetical protein